MKNNTAGDRRHKITLQRQVRVPDEIGGYAMVWQDVAQPIWAGKRQLNGGEKMYHDVLSHNEICVFTIRRRAEKISAEWQIIYANQRYKITGISPQEINEPFVEITAQRDPG